MSTYYKNKLRDPRWQRKKAEILMRDNFTCINCRSQVDNLQVHHIEYLPSLEPWDYPNDMLTTLCEKCHGKEQDRPELENHLATTFNMLGFLYDDLLALSCLLETDTTFKSNLKRALKIFKETNCLHNG